MVNETVWSRRPPGGVFAGRCCIDGSAYHPRDELLCRAGWAVVQIAGTNDEVVGEVHGNLPGYIQQSGLAELFAFLMLLVHGVPPIVAVTDYQGLVDGIANGRVWCTALGREGADLWRKVWHKIDDYGMENVTVIKIPAHQSRA
eukprot:9643507-Heterocapsa_arctica.AAC.1